MHRFKEKYLVYCTYLVVGIVVQTKMTLSESPCRLSVKLSLNDYSVVSETETLHLYITWVTAILTQ